MQEGSQEAGAASNTPSRKPTSTCFVKVFILMRFPLPEAQKMESRAACIYEQLKN